MAEDQQGQRRPKHEGEAKCASSLGQDSHSGELSGECFPGIPEDVALEILARTPRSAGASLRRVSTAFRDMLSSDALRAARASANTLEQWLFALPDLPTGGSFRALDPRAGQWHTLPPLPLAAKAESAILFSSTSSSPISSSAAAAGGGGGDSGGSNSPFSSAESSPTASPPRPSQPLTFSSPKCPSSPTNCPGYSLEGFACVAVSGKLLVIGGSERTLLEDGTMSRAEVTSAVWEFDPTLWEWTGGPPMSTPRGWCAAGVLSDRFVYVTGGQGRDRFLKSVEVYDAQSREWGTASSMHLARSSHKAVVVEGKLIVIAGEVERHDTPVPVAAAPPPRSAPPALLAAGRPATTMDRHSRGGPVRNIGNDAAPPFLEALPFQRRVPHWWQGQAPALRQAPYWMRHGNANGIGNGYGHGPLPVPLHPAALVSSNVSSNASMEVYDVVADSWTLVPDSWLSAKKVPCPVASVAGKLYAVHHSSVHVWDPSAATWRWVGDTPGRDTNGRPWQVSGFDCAELNGEVVLLGGSRDVWLHRTRLTHQHLGSVHSWDPSSVSRKEAIGGGVVDDQHLAGVPRGGAGFQSTTSSIMLWKELPPMLEGGGHILASAVLTF